MALFGMRNGWLRNTVLGGALLASLAGGMLIDKSCRSPCPSSKPAAVQVVNENNVIQSSSAQSKYHLAVDNQRLYNDLKGKHDDFKIFGNRVMSDL